MNLYLSLAILGAVLGMYQFGYNTGNINAPEEEIENFLQEVHTSRYNTTITKEQSKTYFSGVIVSMFLVGLSLIHI